MLLLLESLYERNGLHYFTVLAEAILQAEEVLEYVHDDRVVERFDRMVEHVLCQAYRGDKPMDELADRVYAALEMIPIPQQDYEGDGPGTNESGEWTAVEERPGTSSGTYDAEVSGTYKRIESGTYDAEANRPTGWGDDRK